MEDDCQENYQEALRRIHTWNEKNNKDLWLDLEGLGLNIFPIELFELKNLRLLSLFDNKLSELPKDINQLKTVEKLYLDKNLLCNLPKEICDLKNLKWLSLINNNLRQLPDKISKLEQLETLLIAGNPLEITSDKRENQNILDKIARISDPHTVFSLYFQIDKSILSENWNKRENIIHLIEEKNVQPRENKALLEGRIIIVGNGNAGKTSLRQRLLNESYKNEGRTKGVTIKPYPIIVKNQEVKMNVWDFGGQEIYHTTHKFFFRERCLYVLVIDMRAGLDKIIVKYWLRQIKELSNNAPLLIVCNKSEDEGGKDIDAEYPRRFDDKKIREYKEIYPNIKNFLFVSCGDKPLYIDEVKAEIVKTIENDISEIFYKYPPSYSLVRNSLSNDERNYIENAKFAEICKECGVKEGQQKSLAKILDILGTIIYFEGEFLQDINVLKPEWITKGVYKIISSYRLSQNKGELDRNDVNEILEETAYKDKQRYVISVMEKHSLCFSKKVNNEEKFYFPVYFPTQNKDSKLFGRFKKSYTLKYKRDVSIEKFMMLFIAAKHSESTSYWRHGIVLQRAENRALIEAFTEEEKIEITVEGENANNFLEEIKNYFIEKIHSNSGNPLDEKYYEQLEKQQKKISIINDEKDEKIEQLKQKVKTTSLASKVELLNKQAERKGGALANLLILISVFAHVISIIILIYLIFTYNNNNEKGWDVYEKWTFVVAGMLTVINWLCSVWFFIKTKIDFNWSAFRLWIIENTKKQLYIKEGFSDTEISELQLLLSNQNEHTSK